VDPAEDFVRSSAMHPGAPNFPHDKMTTSLWILYNLERNTHFHRPYQYGLYKGYISFTPEEIVAGRSERREGL
jgi:hypothetical protein